MFDYNLRLNKKTTLRFTFGRLCLLGLAGLGFVLMIYRLVNGLGASTNLSDAWPWGFWIYSDLILSALGSCGFAVGILAHVLHIPKYQPLARRALLMSFLCYLLVFLILFMEIGRWDNFYWIFISFAWTSPLYEVFICLTLYFIMQFFEVGEIWLGRFLPQFHKYTPYIMPFVVLIACVLPFGQEAALGALYLAMPDKLNAIWYSQFLPWGCLISAFYGGLCFIALEYHITNRYFREKSDGTMTAGLLTIAGAVMAVYLALKIIDLSLRGVWGEIFSGSLEGSMFLLEIIVGSLIPMVLTLSPLVKQVRYQLIAAACGIAGILLNRFNFVFVGMADHADAFYFPSGIEIGIVVGMTALVLVVYIFFAENLPVFRNKEDKAPEIVIR